tara:strand:+ start:228 stop:776 length:549 start_codon:yes stop_codon:yes gene_type:complete
MIHEVPNFLSKEVCEQAILYYKSTPEVRLPHQQYDEFFWGRTKPLCTIQDPGVRKMFRVFETMMLQTISKLYPDDGFIYMESCDIVKWPVGWSMGTHTDNLPDPEGHPGSDLTNRDYTTVCYLNDNYEGGSTFFPEYDQECVPEQGKVVFFPASIQHGVTEIQGSTRYTIATWFTKRSEMIY